MSNLDNRIKQLEKQDPPARHSWEDYVSGAWTPGSPAEWRSLLATAKPSEIAARADELIANGATASAEDRAAIASIRRATP